jgi:hypothetical protein
VRLPNSAITRVRIAPSPCQMLDAVYDQLRRADQAQRASAGQPDDHRERQH